MWQMVGYLFQYFLLFYIDLLKNTYAHMNISSHITYFELLQFILCETYLWEHAAKVCVYTFKPFLTLHQKFHEKSGNKLRKQFGKT